MPTQADLVAVARDLRARLDGGVGFIAIDRREITEFVRKQSGEETTRIKSQMARDLEQALLNQSVRCFPSLTVTTTGDQVRLFLTGTIVANLVDVLLHPSDSTDMELAEMTTKITSATKPRQGKAA